MLHFVLVFVTAVVFFTRDHKIRRQRGRKLGGMGRGRRRKARKIALRTLMEDAVCSITGFWFISENMASFRDILILLLESADDDDISKDEFLLLYDRNISKKPRFPLQLLWSVLLKWDGRQQVFGWVSISSECGSPPFSGLAAPLVFQVSPRNHLGWGRSTLYNTETICLPMQIQRFNSTIWSVGFRSWVWFPTSWSMHSIKNTITE